MSSYYDDFEAEVSMLEEAWRHLHEVDPDNEWLKYFDPKEVALLKANLAELIAAVWNMEEFRATKMAMLHLLSKYTAKLRAEAGEPVLD